MVHLLDLSPELTSTIFSYLVVDPSGLSLNLDGCADRHGRYSDLDVGEVACIDVLLTCRRAYEEAGVLLYSRNTFKAHTQARLEWFLDRIGTTNVALLRCVAVSFVEDTMLVEDFRDGRGARCVREVLERFPGLKTGLRDWRVEILGGINMHRAMKVKEGYVYGKFDNEERKRYGSHFKVNSVELGWWGAAEPDDDEVGEELVDRAERTWSEIEASRMRALRQCYYDVVVEVVEAAAEAGLELKEVYEAAFKKQDGTHNERYGGYDGGGQGWRVVLRKEPLAKFELNSTWMHGSRWSEEDQDGTVKRGFNEEGRCALEVDFEKAIVK